MQSVAIDSRDQGAHCQRLSVPGLLGVELWDLETLGGKLLYEHIGNEDFPEVLGETLTRLRDGTARCRWSDTPLQLCRDFDALVLGGGAAPEEIAWDGALHRLPEGAFGAAAGSVSAIRQLDDLGIQRWVVVDVGQTAVKAAYGPCRWSWNRDLESLPIRRPGTDDLTMSGDRVDVEEQRQRLRAFLSRALGEVIAATRPEGLALALPCLLDERLRLRGSSYIGLSGDDTLISDILQTSGVDGLTVRILNDAELAALAAKQQLRRGEKALVVTVGFAIGGAVFGSEA